MAVDVRTKLTLGVAVFFFLVGCRMINNNPDNRITLQSTSPGSPPDFVKTLDAIPTWTNFSTLSPAKILFVGSPTERFTQTISPTPTETPTLTISTVPTRTRTPTPTKTLIPTRRL